MIVTAIDKKTGNQYEKEYLTPENAARKMSYFKSYRN